MLVLLPTESSKLTAQWQGLYKVLERIGKVNYRIRMEDRRKKQAVFHINMLHRWHTPTSTGFLTQEVEDEQDDLPFWNDGGAHSTHVGSHLNSSQVQA